MAEPKGMVVPLLKEIRSEMNSCFLEFEYHLDGVNRRLDSIDQIQQDCLDTLNARNRTAAEYFERIYRPEMGF